MPLPARSPGKIPPARPQAFAIAVIDDEADIRSAISDYLTVSGYTCHAFAGVEEFLAQPSAIPANCLLLDVMLGSGSDGIAAIPTLRAAVPGLPIVIMTAHGDIAMAVRAMRAGAADFLEKPFSMSRLTEALSRILERQRTVLDAQQRIARLTSRELEVMAALVRGLSNKEVAAEIGLSPRTVEVHRAAIMMKLQLQSFAEMVRLAIMLGEDWPPARPGRG